MKSVLMMAAAVLIFTNGAFAADGGQGQGGGQKMTVAQKKAEILAHIDERISNSQAEKVCVQGASSHDELRACREKYRPKKLDNQPQGGGGQGK